MRPLILALCGMRTVSYTHLDVYKRQPPPEHAIPILGTLEELLLKRVDSKEVSLKLEVALLKKECKASLVYASLFFNQSVSAVDKPDAFLTKEVSSLGQGIIDGA